MAEGAAGRAGGAGAPPAAPGAPSATARKQDGGAGPDPGAHRSRCGGGHGLTGQQRQQQQDGGASLRRTSHRGALRGETGRKGAQRARKRGARQVLAGPVSSCPDPPVPLLAPVPSPFPVLSRPLPGPSRPLRTGDRRSAWGCAESAGRIPAGAGERAGRERREEAGAGQAEGIGHRHTTF